MDAPEEVVLELELGRRLEDRDGAPLRVHLAEHLANRSILAGRVAPLKDDEERVALVGPQQALELGDALRLPLGGLLQLLLAHVVRQPGVGVGQSHRFLRLDGMEFHGVSWCEC